MSTQLDDAHPLMRNIQHVAGQMGQLLAALADLKGGEQHYAVVDIYNTVHIVPESEGPKVLFSYHGEVHIDPTTTMAAEDAFALVLDLARAAALDLDAVRGDDNLRAERKRQLAAIDKVDATIASLRSLVREGGK